MALLNVGVPAAPGCSTGAAPRSVLHQRKKLRRKRTELDLFEKRNDFTHLRWSLSLENLRSSSALR